MMPQRAPSIAELSRMDTAALVLAYRAVLGRSPPNGRCREVLINSLAYELQARRYGGLKPGARRRIRAIRDGGEKPSVRRGTRLRPGITIVKRWQGATYTVMVLDRGFAYAGHTYASLSEVARAITGTRWSGPAFFGLRPGNGRAAELRVDGE